MCDASCVVVVVDDENEIRPAGRGTGSAIAAILAAIDDSAPYTVNRVDTSDSLLARVQSGLLPLQQGCVSVETALKIA